MQNKQQINALVIGGMNMDVLGMAHGSYQPGDSLPGSISLSPGGVGRNIAHQLVNLGARTDLLTLLGNDVFASILQTSCNSLGIDLGLSQKKDLKTPVYLAIHDQAGDMISAINDMDSLQALSPAHIQTCLATTSVYDICVLDANLSEACLLVAAATSSFPLMADPVSAVKCKRLLPVLNKLTAIKPNLMEAKALSGQSNMQDAASKLLDLGVGMVFISLGPEGIYYASRQARGHLPAPALPPVALTGAGDAMTAGLAFGLAHNLAVEEIAALGITSAHQYLSSK